jgi:hypothetical protein
MATPNEVKRSDALFDALLNLTLAPLDLSPTERESWRDVIRKRAMSLQKAQAPAQVIQAELGELLALAG